MSERPPPRPLFSRTRKIYAIDTALWRMITIQFNNATTTPLRTSTT
jgi:hypothetical protein